MAASAGRNARQIWILAAFIQSQMIETLAGRQAETLAGYDPLDEAVSTDVAIAKLYAEGALHIGRRG